MNRVCVAGVLVLGLLGVFAVGVQGEDHVLDGDPVCFYFTGNHTNTTGFACKNGDCIPLAQRCDGVNDCGDNSDEKSCPGQTSWVGYVAAAVAAFFFGSNFVPVKKYETGDGMFFQWVLCSAIWCVGIFVNLVKGQVPFQPYAVLGGVSWATGNLTVVPAVKAIGLAQGLLVWGSINMIMGWAAARFGWFGIVAEVPNSPTLQYLGIVCAAVSTLLYAAVKTEVGGQKQDGDASEAVHLLRNLSLQDADTRKDAGWVEDLSPPTRRIVGLVLSVMGGICYSMTFNPSQYVMDNEKGASQDALNYAFSQYCGIFMASTFWFIVYCCYTRSSPAIYPKVILPGFVSGIMWAIAQTAWFVANQRLSQAVSYPIVTTLPGIIATLWGTLVFREIRGLRNYLILGIAYAVTFAGVTLVVMSN